jgi:hypothetical protein
VARRLGIAAAFAAAAAAISLLVYGVGRLAGGSYRFTTGAAPAEVDAVTVAGFSFVPLFLGLAVVAVVGRLSKAALVVGPVLALGTIVLMTLPADFDGVSKTALAICHVMLVPVIVLAVRTMARTSRPVTAGTTVSSPR